MPKSIKRVYSANTTVAAALLGAMIREARLSRKLVSQDVANRAGISRGLLHRIEKGNPKCEIGVVFEVANIVGVKLFDSDQSTLRASLRQTDDRLGLLPKSARKIPRTVHDDF